MQPDKNQQILLQPDSPGPTPPTESNGRRKKLILVAILVALLIIVVIAGAFLLTKANTPTSRSSGTQEDAKTETVAVPEPVELKEYSNAEGGFSMLVPRDMEIEGDRDRVIEGGGYRAQGMTGTKGIGNRFVNVDKYIYPEVFGVEFDQWLEEQIAFVESTLRSAEEEWPEGIEGKVIFQSTTYVSDYTAYGMRTETVTQPRSESSKVNTTFEDYLFVYISPTVFYHVIVKGNDKDTDFRAASTKMLQSFSIR